MARGYGDGFVSWFEEFMMGAFGKWRLFVQSEEVQDVGRWVDIGHGGYGKGI